MASRKAVWVEGQLSDWTDSILSKDYDDRINMMGDGAAGGPLNHDGDTAAVVRRWQVERDDADGAGNCK